MSRKEECCGTCAYHKRDDDVDFICTCEESDGYGEYTMFRDCCDYWRRKADGKGARERKGLRYLQLV